MTYTQEFNYVGKTMLPEKLKETLEETPGTLKVLLTDETVISLNSSAWKEASLTNLTSCYLRDTNTILSFVIHLLIAYTSYKPFWRTRNKKNNLIDVI